MPTEGLICTRNVSKSFGMICGFDFLRSVLFLWFTDNVLIVNGSYERGGNDKLGKGPGAKCNTVNYLWNPTYGAGSKALSLTSDLPVLEFKWAACNAYLIPIGNCIKPTHVQGDALRTQCSNFMLHARIVLELNKIVENFVTIRGMLRGRSQAERCSKTTWEWTMLRFDFPQGLTFGFAPSQKVRNIYQASKLHCIGLVNISGIAVLARNSGNMLKGVLVAARRRIKFPAGHTTYGHWGDARIFSVSKECWWQQGAAFNYKQCTCLNTFRLKGKTKIVTDYEYNAQSLIVHKK
ncbi:hypothetical protein B0H17DRAFT_1141628 [Mycena rosella]|uniref:Uncharacterized protein n=1 Tax=Mycena rosella TaxID=1033263 RepID=A0AAD7CZC5_MYCRO|nr:hypothetical protein B0H17DRAFT_1141628 [Mycena rosella]